MSSIYGYGILSMYLGNETRSEHIKIPLMLHNYFRSKENFTTLIKNEMLLIIYTSNKIVSTPYLQNQIVCGHRQYIIILNIQPADRN